MLEIDKQARSRITIQIFTEWGLRMGVKTKKNPDVY